MAEVDGVISERTRVAVEAALSGVKDAMSDRVQEVKQGALDDALDAQALRSLVASAVAAAIQQHVDTAAEKAAGTLSEHEQAGMRALQSAAEKHVASIKAELSAPTPHASEKTSNTGVVLSEFARQFPHNVAAAALGGQVALGADATTGTDTLLRLKSLVEECSELMPVPPTGKGSPIQSMLLAQAQGQAAVAGQIAAAAPGTAAKAAACAEAYQALQAFSGEGAKRNNNPAILLHSSVPVPGDAWVINAPSAKVTVLLPQPEVITRVGVLAPTAFQVGHTGVPVCRVASISAVCADEGQVPSMLLSATALEWDDDAHMLGQVFIPVEGAAPCSKIVLTAAAESGAQVCMHRLVLQV
jgi:hypothetical protein